MKCFKEILVSEYTNHYCLFLRKRIKEKEKKSKKDERKDKKEERDDETDEPKPKRRKSGDDKDKKKKIGMKGRSVIISVTSSLS